MKPIPPSQRLVANIHKTPFEPFMVDGAPSAGESVLQLDDTFPKGAGFHVYRMAPGTHTTPHEHTCHEQFLVLEGDLTDHDGFVYHPGDLVLVKKGTRHNSRTRNGCLLAVFIASPEANL